MPTRTLPKMSKLCFRFSENQKMKVRRPPKNHQKSMKKPLRKHVDKKSPKFVQNGSTWGPTWVPRGDCETGVAPLGAQHFSFSCFCCFLWPSWGILGPSWDTSRGLLGPILIHFGSRYKVYRIQKQEHDLNSRQVIANRPCKNITSDQENNNFSTWVYSLVEGTQLCFVDIINVALLNISK